MDRHEIPGPGGRTLEVVAAGEEGAPALVFHHGSPGSGLLHSTEIESAERLGARLIAYSRPGFGGSSPAEGRVVADAAEDVAAILDALGVERFATYGWSGGGPHALACAALLGDRCAAAATIAGIGAHDASDLDWMAGMGEGNIAEFGAAREGREPLAELLAGETAGLMSVSPDQLAEAIRPHLSEVDAAVLTGELAAYLTESMQNGLRGGPEGWIEDDLAFTAPWGFDLSAITAPVLVWQGEHDLMVPPAHGSWLRAHVPGAEGQALAGEGHLTLANRIGDVHAWLLKHL